jgi:hypothetical protein
MQLVNFTPFSPFAFSPLDKNGNESNVIILKGTFQFAPNGALLRADEQEPLIMADQLHGEPGRSSLKRESDLVPFKPRAEILLCNSIARAPGGKPLQAWEVGVVFRDVAHRFRVTGPRHWDFTDGEWQLTPPKAVEEVKLLYENAFGGYWETEDANDVCKENPVGCGLVNVETLDRDVAVNAPQMEMIDDPIGAIGKRYKVAGLGPIHRSWQPRLGLAGDFDDKWKEEKWPLLPDNFDPSHYNAAPPFLTFAEPFHAGERISLYRLTTDGRLEFCLPTLDVFVLKRYVDGAMAAEPLKLDTLEIDFATNKCYLVWRVSIPPLPLIRVAETRMIAKG